MAISRPFYLTDYDTATRVCLCQNCLGAFGPCHHIRRQEIGPPRAKDKAIGVRARMRENVGNPTLRFPPLRDYRRATVQHHGLSSR